MPTVFRKYDTADMAGALRLSVGFKPYEELEEAVVRCLDALP